METGQKRILIVDDDLDIQEVFSEILTSEGYDVTTASNGKDALSKLLACNSEQLPNLIILDSHMPQMSGRQFLQAIREHTSEDLKRISILLSSGDNAKSDDGFPDEVRRMQKPIEFNTLVSSVAESFHQMNP